MSDLVGNPEDRFSQNEAHMPRLMLRDSVGESPKRWIFDPVAKMVCITYEPRCEKTGLRAVQRLQPQKMASGLEFRI